MAPSSKVPLSHTAVSSAMQKIGRLNLAATSINKIRKLLNLVFDGYTVTAPTFDRGNLLFSGYTGVKPSTISELGCLPSHLSPLRRANLPGSTGLYCYTDKRAAVDALKPELGSGVVLVHWVTTAPLVVNCVGYTRRVFADLNSTRSIPDWGANSSAQTNSAHAELVDFVADTFIRRCSPNDRATYYRLTAAIAEIMLSAPQVNGLVYPSVEACGNAETFFLKASFAKENLRFLKVEYIRIDARRDAAYDITTLDTASDLDGKGQILWFSKYMVEDSQSNTRYGTVGWQEFLAEKKSILREYDEAKELNINRPTHTEHGNVGEASLRRWLGEFLPKKYGVTSGYIIPDVRSFDYTIRHYDVIIYDIQNAPVLWVSKSADKSEQGKARAIPAEHVHAVLEVKATMNKANIAESIAKLQELNEYQLHLPKHFASAIIFFELKAGEQTSCKFIENLFNQSIPGYFGGMVLRAENFDPAITGYFWFHTANNETVENMPAVREIGALQRNEKGDPQLTQQGDNVVAHAYEGRWHFDKSYSPVVKNLELTWGYNGFPNFCIDLLERLQGTYDPKTTGKRGAYGLSFNR